MWFPGRASVSLDAHLDAAYRWMCAAQDASPDGGVAGCYNLVKGWRPSYPETTGYIIPTFIGYAGIRREGEARERAIRMADWEIDVQLPNGAVRSGMLGTKPGPAVFNTGQVLFGWAGAYTATGEGRYRGAAANASRWLIGVQDDDGAWRRHLSMLTTSSIQTYNVRTAWGLAVAARVFDERQWLQAALKNCDWALTQQTANGWFHQNAFADGEDPLLHTIGYVLEGLLGVGRLADRPQYVEAVLRGIEPLIDLYERTGRLFGRYNAQWKPVVRWRCLTGEAQLALVLLRLSAVTGETSCRTTARALLESVAQLQDTDSPYPQSHGAISGSHPLWGAYGRFNYLNWAVKFFMDAVMLERYGIDVQNETTTNAAPAYR